MSGVQRLLPNFTLEQTILYGLSKLCWGKLIIKESTYDLIDGNDWSPKLISHRNKVIRKVPEILNSLPKTSPLTLPSRIIDKVINAVHNLFEGYEEALNWEKKFESCLPFTILNPFTSGKYEAGNFIDANRHFNDFEWTKTFVADEEQLIHTRFEFACIYCLEEDIIRLWNIMKRKELLPCEVDIDRIKLNCNSFVALWAYNLEGQFYILAEDEDNSYNESFYYIGIQEALFFHYEYAMQYFWNRLSELERREFLSCLEGSCIYSAISSANMSNFIYSILSQQRKQSAIFFADETGDHFMIWSNLLHSRLYESVLEDILSLSFSVPVHIYWKLLGLLSEVIIRKQIPIHMCIFKRIWNRLSNNEQMEILEMEEYRFRYLKEVIFSI